MPCIFCRIVKKEIPAEIVYEGEGTLAFLDIQPRSPGHTLLILREHRATLLDATPGEISALAVAAQHVSRMLEQKLHAEGITIGINHRPAAGQEVDHLHVHLIPRFARDGGGPIQIIVSNPPRESIQEIAKKLRSS